MVNESMGNANDAFARGRLAEAREEFTRAFEDAARSGDAATMGHAALGLGGLWVNERRTPDEYAEYREQLLHTLHTIGDEQPTLRARLMVRLAAEACYAEGAPPADLRSAVETVRAFDDPGATAEALSLLHHVLLAPHDRTEREHVAHDLVAVAARDTNTPQTALTGLMWSTIDAFLAGDTEAPRRLARLRLRARELDHAAISYLARVIELMCWLRAGRIAEVEHALDEVHTMGVDVGEADASPWMAGQILSIRWLQGRQHEVLDVARAVADSPDLTRSNRVYPAVWAAFAAASGARDEAHVALARVDPFGDPPHGLAPSSMWLVSMFAVVEALRHLADAERAEQAYRLLTPFADLPIMGSLAVVCFGSTHRPLAWCAIVAGDIERGVEHFHRAIAHDLQLGNLPMLAITRAELAAALGPNDPAAARGLLSAAIASGTEFGMARWVEQWEAQQQTLRDATIRPEHQGQWCRRGSAWEIEVGSTRVVVPHSIGLHMISVLIASPYRDISAAILAGASETPTRQVVLDASARDALRRRVQELHTRIERADATGNRAQSAQLCDELDHITAELATTLRPGGLSRTFTTPAERARTSVQKAIRRAVDRINDQAPDLAEKLRRSIHTGTHCRYQPTNDLPHTWNTTKKP